MFDFFALHSNLLLKIAIEKFDKYYQNGDIIQYFQKMSDILPNIGDNEICIGILLKNSAANLSIALEIANEYEKRHLHDLKPLVKSNHNGEYVIIIPIYDTK